MPSNISVFDLFKIGIGPSSSHTVGPMVAANHFVQGLDQSGVLTDVCRLLIKTYGSLALTGRGHATDHAILLGLSGEQPHLVDPAEVPAMLENIRRTHCLKLAGKHIISLDPAEHYLELRDQLLPGHTNGMTFAAFDKDGALLKSGTYYSIGGGFVIKGDGQALQHRITASAPPPYPFRNARHLLQLAEENALSIAELVLKNECAQRPEEQVLQGLDDIWQAMEQCIERGCNESGTLPGGLNVPRRAANLRANLVRQQETKGEDALSGLDWINLYALAVNEENACGGRVVTAPTNGAAGIIPAVLAYHIRHCGGEDRKDVATFLLTAAAIGSLYKKNAAISGAEVGCQGEIGVACSMAAAGLTAVLGGTNAQIENAAEIGMEHNLGLTCDPVGGLVQIPCIERNAVGAVKAVQASRLALKGDGTHKISLDAVIETMRQTGADMQTKYKETSLGGLAVNFVEC
ncbi:L-serine ammonia-lyase [Sneathiella chinensis]|uniref:L-serine dehydratase n=1 Tax=Sneathiella chinensis TaxID=349750 RepID=A0ABQ5TZ43_9PROT|nr:L-serine ammonia-lyase [Sneathiella chinensis]GLQ05149.1 L-serine dehydratase [Sneathiella chinensis]